MKHGALLSHVVILSAALSLQFLSSCSTSSAHPTSATTQSEAVSGGPLKTHHKPNGNNWGYLAMAPVVWATAPIWVPICIMDLAIESPSCEDREHKGRKPPIKPPHIVNPPPPTS